MLQEIAIFLYHMTVVHTRYFHYLLYYNPVVRNATFSPVVVAFNDVTIEWMVVGRVRLDKQDSAAYRLAFTKFFETCKLHDRKFELNQTLVGIVTDWSDAEINGLKEAVGKKVAESLLKGCKVHWLRSCQRVAYRVVSSRRKHMEKRVFLEISSTIQSLQSAVDIVACFEALCGVHTLA